MIIRLTNTRAKISPDKWSGKRCNAQKKLDMIIIPIYSLRSSRCKSFRYRKTIINPRGKNTRHMTYNQLFLKYQERFCLSEFSIVIGDISLLIPSVDGPMNKVPTKLL